MMGYVYPRLPGTIAEQELQKRVDELERNGGDPSGIGSSVRPHPLASYDQTGARVPEELLKELRQKIMDAAVAKGFPSPLPTTSISSLDHHIAELVFEHMKMVPGEVGQTGVWNHMTLVLLPDFMAWRWPSMSSARFYTSGGGKAVRNYFMVSWVRAWLFYDESHETDRFHLLKMLSQDAMLQIIERPHLSRNRKLARVLARLYGKHRGMVPNFTVDYFRPLMARIVTIGTIVRYDFFSEEQLTELVEREWETIKPEESEEGSEASGSTDASPGEVLKHWGYAEN